jgi:hypothetical protein
MKDFFLEFSTDSYESSQIHLRLSQRCSL